jgi:TRAP-type uncharacterized transport system fused permease subunit
MTDETLAQANPHDPLAEGFPANGQGRTLFWIAVAFSSFQILTAAHLLDMPSQIVRAVHVGFLMLLGFPLLALMRGARRPVVALAWAAALAGVAVAAYQWWEFVPLLMRAGDPLPIDIAVGVLALVLVFAAAWAMMGLALPIIAGCFLA